MLGSREAHGETMTVAISGGQALGRRRQLSDEVAAYVRELIMSGQVRHGEFLRLERPGLHVLRVVLSTLEVAAFFVAVRYLPLADVITFYLASPIFVTALSALVLREQVGWRRWCAVGVGFCGVLIAMQPSAQTITWPALIALGGSTCFAVLMLITRSLRGASDAVLASSQFIGTFTFGALLLPFGWVTPGLPGFGLFASGRHHRVTTSSFSRLVVTTTWMCAT